jgi:serine/threonine protein kinase
MSKEYISSPTKNSKITLTADISDHYNILDIIGEGTFGKVKSAIHIQTGEKASLSFNKRLL